MKPFSIYHLCKDAFSLLQQPLVDCILTAAKPEMIFLLGLSLHRRRSESIFNISAPASQYISECFLLILIKDLANKELYEWQDKIENSCKTLMPVTVIVLQTFSFEQWLNAAHRFASTVWQSSLRIYDSGNLSGPNPNATINIVVDKEYEPQYTDGLTKAKEFLAGSELFRVRKQLSMAAFMLHQSAEQALRTLLKMGTGYYVNTHSLDRLLRYASLVDHQLPDIFPQKTAEGKRLFGLLQKAYTDARYKDEYRISNDDLVCLTEKVRHIHEILLVVGKRYILPPAAAAKVLG